MNLNGASLVIGGDSSSLLCQQAAHNHVLQGCMMLRLNVRNHPLLLFNISGECPVCLVL